MCRLVCTSFFSEVRTELRPGFDINRLDCGLRRNDEVEFNVNPVSIGNFLSGTWLIEYSIFRGGFNELSIYREN